MAELDAGVVFISKIGQDVHQMGDLLRGSNTILIGVHEPFANLVVVITSLEDYMTKGIQFAGYVEDFLVALKRAFQFCKYLGELVPVVGPFLAQAASFIEKLNIEDRIRKIVHEIKSIIIKARDGLMVEIKTAATKICGQLEALLRHLPGWIDTAHIVEMTFQLVAFLLPLCVQSTEAIAKAIADKFKALIGDATSQFKGVGDVLHKIKEFLDAVWTPVKNAILEPIMNGFKAVWEILQPVFDVVKHCSDVCGTIQEWLEPFFWVMHAVEWIFEHTVGWLIKKIMNVCRVDNVVNDLMEKLEKSLGITAAKDFVENTFGSMMEGVSQGLHSLTEGVDIGNIPDAMIKLTQQLQTFQKHPLESFLMLTDQGLNPRAGGGKVPHPLRVPGDNYINFMAMPSEHDTIETSPRESKRRRITATPSDPIIVSDTKPLASTPEDFFLELLGKKQLIREIFGVPEEEVRGVEKQQQHMNDFVASVFIQEDALRPDTEGLKKYISSESRTVSDTISLCVTAVPSSEEQTSRVQRQYSSSASLFTVSGFESSAAPMLSLASTGSECVSVIIRTRHKRILNDQAMARTYALKDERPRGSSPGKQKWSSTGIISASDSMATSFSPRTIWSAESGAISGLPGGEIPKPGGGSAAQDGELQEGDSSTPLAKKIERYKEEVDKLAGIITDTLGFLGDLMPICERADDDFLSFTPDALDFTTHLMALMDGLDPIFDTVIELLGLPEEYHDMEEKAVRDLVANMGLPESFANIIHPFLKAFSKLRVAITTLKQDKQDVQVVAGSISEPYKTLCGHVSLICSPNSFLKCLGPNINSLYAFVIALTNRLSGMHNDFLCLREMGQQLYDSLGSSTDAQALLGRLEHVYDKLLPAACQATENVQALAEKLKVLEKALYPLHEDVRRFFSASQALSKMCFTLESKLLAADRVRAICARIHNALGPFRELVGKPEVITPVRTSTGNAIFDAISELFSDVSFVTASVLLERFFKFPRLQNEMVDLRHGLSNKMTGDVVAFQATLQEIMQLAEARNLNMYSPQVLTLKIPVHSPLMDEETSKEFNDILKQVNALSKDEDFQPGKMKTADDLVIETPRWSRSDLNQENITVETVQRWGMRWDEANPNSPDQHFVEWYELLDDLTHLMKRREQWQRLDVSQVRAEIPAILQPGSSESKLWEVLENKATEGGSHYHTNVVEAIQKPLQDRLEKLISGTLPLNPIAPDDILNLLSSPENSKIPHKYLPSKAYLVAAKKGKLPDGLTKLFDDQLRFENIRRGLIDRLQSLKHVSNSGIDADKAIEALETLWHDFNCIGGRMLLEMTADWQVAMEFLKAAEDPVFLKSGWLDPAYTA